MFLEAKSDSCSFPGHGPELLPWLRISSPALGSPPLAFWQGSVARPHWALFEFLLELLSRRRQSTGYVCVFVLYFVHLSVQIKIRT